MNEFALCAINGCLGRIIHSYVRMRDFCKDVDEFQQNQLATFNNSIMCMSYLAYDFTFYGTNLKDESGLINEFVALCNTDKFIRLLRKPNSLGMWWIAEKIETLEEAQEIFDLVNDFVIKYRDVMIKDLPHFQNL